MTILSLPSPCYFYANSTIPPFVVEHCQCPDETRSPFSDCDSSCRLTEKNIVRDRATKDVWFVHYGFKHFVKKPGISKAHQFSPVFWRGGAAMASITHRHN